MMRDIEGLILLFRVPAMLQLKPWRTREHLIILLIWAAIIHMLFFLALSKFSVKAIRMWGQTKISSCCLCVWCKSNELGCRFSTRFQTPMVESFSADFLPFIESYWTELHLEFCETSMTELLCEICGLLLDDWAHGGYIDGLLHLW